MYNHEHLNKSSLIVFQVQSRAVQVGGSGTLPFGSHTFLAKGGSPAQPNDTINDQKW